MTSVYLDTGCGPETCFVIGDWINLLPRSCRVTPFTELLSGIYKLHTCSAFHSQLYLNTEAKCCTCVSTGAWLRYVGRSFLKLCTQSYANCLLIEGLLPNMQLSLRVSFRGQTGKSNWNSLIVAAFLFRFYVAQEKVKKNNTSSLHLPYLYILALNW